MLTEKDYCDYETCVALKELGYKVPTSTYYMPHHKDLIWVSNPFRGGYVTDCFYSHNSLPKDVMTANFIDAPTLWEAQKWLREEKNIEVNASFDKEDDGWIAFIQRLDYPDLYGTDVFSTVYNTYESALSESIKEAVKILAIC
jgi:hypothetical protein